MRNRDAKKDETTLARLRQAQALWTHYGPEGGSRDPRNIAAGHIDLAEVLATYSQLERIEINEHRRAERECNGDISPTDEQSAAHDKRTAEKIVGLYPRLDPAAIMINGDPRGYALKLTDAASKDAPEELHRDWGRNVILAPTA